MRDFAPSSVSLGIALMLVSFVAACVWLSAGKDLWLDELFTWYQVRDKNFSGLFDATATGFNLMPAGHFLLLWLVDQIGWLTSWSARLLSLVAITGGIVTLIGIWRRLWGAEVSLILTAILVSSSLPLIMLAIEVRPYALSFFLSIIALKCALVMAENPTSYRAAALNTLCSFALPFVSYPSGLYSAALLVGYGLSCWIEHRRPSPWALGSFVVGWAVFLLVSGETLLRQVAQNSAGLHHAAPHLSELFGLYPTLVGFPLGLILVLLVAMALEKRRDGPRSEVHHTVTKATTVPMPLALWLFVPIGVFILAKVGATTIWGARFFLPTAAAVASIPGPFLAVYFSGHSRRRQALHVAIAAVAILSFSTQAVSIHRANRDAPVRSFAAQLPPEFRRLPLIVTELNTYFHLLHYADRTLDVRYFAGTTANKQLLGRVSTRLRPVVSDDILQLSGFVMLVDADNAWATGLRAQFTSHRLVVKQTQFCTVGFIKELWRVERSDQPAQRISAP